MKIKVYSRGTTDIDADGEYQEPAIREALAAGGDVGSEIIDCTDTERSDISHDEYAIVTEDDGTELWRGWLTGDPDAPAPDSVTYTPTGYQGPAQHTYTTACDGFHEPGQDCNLPEAEAGL